MWRPNKWGAGLEVEAGVGPQPLLFLVSHLCHYGGLKLSTVLPQALRVSRQQALMTPQCHLEPNPFPASLFKEPGLGLSSPPPGPSGAGGGRCPSSNYPPGQGN